MQVDELHEATERDRMRVAAGRALIETYRLKYSPDSREQVVQKLEGAVSLFALPTTVAAKRSMPGLVRRSFVARTTWRQSTTFNKRRGCGMTWLSMVRKPQLSIAWRTTWAAWASRRKNLLH